MLDSNLTLWAENAVKFQHKLSDQIKMKAKQKRIRNGVGGKIKMIQNLGGKSKNQIQA